MGLYNSKVTVELRELVESGIRPFDFDYPSYYKGEQKAAFEQKVIDHYWFRQIGMETPGRWLHFFRSRVREIMPYYLQLYKSQEIMDAIEDPFGNVDVTETFEQETTGKTSGTSESSGTSETMDEQETASITNTHNERKFSDTPQGIIINLDDHLTEATVEDNTSEVSGSSGGKVTAETTATGTTSDTSEGTTKYTLTKKGNQGVNTYAHDMKELRETFLNIDMMVIRELEDLFLMVY